VSAAAGGWSGLLAALRGTDELLVTSRTDGREVTVRMTFAATPRGELYLMTGAFSRKARRWERDPWVRLTVPGSVISAEGRVRCVPAGELSRAAEAAVLDRFATSGAATPEGLRQLLESGTHLLLRVEPEAEARTG
jgi:hypothetical protein